MTADQTYRAVRAVTAEVGMKMTAHAAHAVRPESPEQQRALFVTHTREETGRHVARLAGDEQAPSTCERAAVERTVLSRVFADGPFQLLLEGSTIQTRRQLSHKASTWASSHRPARPRRGRS